MFPFFNLISWPVVAKLAPVKSKPKGFCASMLNSFAVETALNVTSMVEREPAAFLRPVSFTATFSNCGRICHEG